MLFYEALRTRSSFLRLLLDEWTTVVVVLLSCRSLPGADEQFESANAMTSVGTCMGRAPEGRDITNLFCLNAMTAEEADYKLKHALELIFEVESQFEESEHPCIDGYRARIAVGGFQNELRKHKFPVRDWAEDFEHENGNYRSVCIKCRHPFTGHKRRSICKACHGA